MDYCHACRRHLNGALACAGCGTPVEELRYETPHVP
ncbi:SCO2400 family protein, partial [Streptomyces exfoliatus]